MKKRRERENFRNISSPRAAENTKIPTSRQAHDPPCNRFLLHAMQIRRPGLEIVISVMRTSRKSSSPSSTVAKSYEPYRFCGDVREWAGCRSAIKKVKLSCIFDHNRFIRASFVRQTDKLSFGKYVVASEVINDNQSHQKIFEKAMIT